MYLGKKKKGLIQWSFLNTQRRKRKTLHLNICRLLSKIFIDLVFLILLKPADSVLFPTSPMIRKTITFHKEFVSKIKKSTGTSTSENSQIKNFILKSERELR